MKGDFNKKKRNSWREKVICLLFACVLLIGLEFLSRLIFSCHDQMDQILQILQQDSLLFWRQKPNLNLNFQNTQVKTNSFGLRNKNVQFEKDKGSFRIVCLGGSPTFGWGVDSKDAYPYQLEKLIREKYDFRKRIEVINAGNIGYSSYQGLNFLKKYILNFFPDLITVSYVINDVDKHRFYRSNGKSDVELTPKSKVLVAIENFFNKSNIFKLLKKGINHSRGMAAKYFSEGGRGTYLEKRRVSLEDYRNNLNQIIDIAAQNNIKIIFIKMPVNLPMQEEVSESLRLKADFCIGRALEYTRNGKYVFAVNEYKKALTFNPYSSKAFYYLGICSTRQRKPEEAKSYFQRAKKMELFQCQRLAKLYNKTMEEVAIKRKIPLVDIVLTFNAFHKKYNKYLFLDPKGDTIHPNVTGHKIIAGQVCDVLIKYYFIDKGNY